MLYNSCTYKVVSHQIIDLKNQLVGNSELDMKACYRKYLTHEFFIRIRQNGLFDTIFEVLGNLSFLGCIHKFFGMLSNAPHCPWTTSFIPWLFSLKKVLNYNTVKRERSIAFSQVIPHNRGNNGLPHGHSCPKVDFGVCGQPLSHG